MMPIALATCKMVGNCLMRLARVWLTRRPRSLPDLILLDLNMPVLNGREVLLEIKNDSRFCKIPVVIFTSSHAEDDVKSTYGSGANSCISKPTSLSGFARVVGSLDTYWLKLVRLPYST